MGNVGRTVVGVTLVSVSSIGHSLNETSRTFWRGMVAKFKKLKNKYPNRNIQINSGYQTSILDLLYGVSMTYSPLIVKSDIQPENLAVDDTSLSDMVKSVPPMYRGRSVNTSAPDLPILFTIS